VKRGVKKGRGCDAGSSGEVGVMAD
jgi:hypothetical protein